MNKETKVLILEKLQDFIQQKIENTQQDISNTIDSRNSDTKSSAGDKHETSRAMIQIDLEHLQKQLNHNMELMKELERINVERNFQQVETGSLVETNLGTYFIAIGMGKIEINNQIFFVISMESPIGMKLKDKKVGEDVLFQDREIRIEAII